MGFLRTSNQDDLSSRDERSTGHGKRFVQGKWSSFGVNKSYLQLQDVPKMVDQFAGRVLPQNSSWWCPNIFTLYATRRSKWKIWCIVHQYFGLSNGRFSNIKPVKLGFLKPCTFKGGFWCLGTWFSRKRRFMWEGATGLLLIETSFGYLLD